VLQRSLRSLQAAAFFRSMVSSLRYSVKHPEAAWLVRDIDGGLANQRLLLLQSSLCSLQTAAMYRCMISSLRYSVNNTATAAAAAGSGHLAGCCLLPQHTSGLQRMVNNTKKQQQQQQQQGELTSLRVLSMQRGSGAVQSINQSITRVSSKRGQPKRRSTLKPPLVGSQPASAKADKQGPVTAKLPTQKPYMTGLP
jgi:hypothetical protein